jgi:MFS superfamily sulfate permease-like transporter
VLLAAIMSLIILIRRAAHPHTAVLGRIPGTTQFGDVQRHAMVETTSDLLVYRVYGGIVYFNVEYVERDLHGLLRSRDRPVTRVIFDLSSSPVVDLAGVRMLASLHEQLTAKGITFELAEARGAVRDLLRAEGVTARPGLNDPSQSLAALCGT